MPHPGSFIAACALVAAACGGRPLGAAEPHVDLGLEDGNGIAAGQSIGVSTAYTAECAPDTLEIIATALSNATRGPGRELEHREPYRPQGGPCAGEAHVVIVRCTGPCLADGLLVETGATTLQAPRDGGRLQVIPLEPGEFRVDVEVRRTALGEPHAAASRALVVRAPDSLGLFCAYAEDGSLERCDGRPLSATRPLIAVVAQYSDSIYQVFVPTLNGRKVRHADGARDAPTLTHSLADVFPDAAAGGLRPGPYVVEIGFAGMTTTETVVVR